LVLGLFYIQNSEKVIKDYDCLIIMTGVIS